MAYTDREGNTWKPCEQNQFQQRQVRCIKGPRKGETILDSSLSGRPDARAQRQEPAMSDWERAIHEPTDFENW